MFAYVIYSCLSYKGDVIIHRECLINKEGHEKCFLVIVLSRVLQLYAYIPSCQMKDQSAVVCLENVCLFDCF